LIAEDHWCHDSTDEDLGDISLEQGDVDLLNDAFWKVNHYMQFVVDFFEYHVNAWDYQMFGCVVARVMGLYLGDPFTVAEGTLATGAKASTVWSTRMLTMSSEFMTAVEDYRDDTSNDANYGDWNCPTAEVAGTLFHESFHSCGVASERLPYLANAYFRFRYKDQWGFTDPLCCQRSALSSWDEDDVSCDDIDSSVLQLGYDGWTGSDLFCGTPASCW